MQMGQPIVFFRTEIFCLLPLVSPRRPIRILDRQVAQWVWQPVRKSVIQAHQLTVKNVIRPPVGHDVVKYPDHYVIVVCNAHQRNAGEWPLLQVERFPYKARNDFMRGCFRIRFASHVYDRSGKLHVRNKLERLAINSLENRAQYLMALRYNVEASFE